MAEKIRHMIRPMIVSLRRLYQKGDHNWLHRETEDIRSESISRGTRRGSL